MHPVFHPGAVALITGAASGIGLAAAKLCHRAGMNLILADVDEQALAAATADLPSTPHLKISSVRIDVSNLADWQRLQEEVASTYPGGVDFLMLNAGASHRPAADKTPWTDPDYFQKTFAVNTFGYTNGIAAFLDAVTKNKDHPRAIVLTGSKQGITNPPGNPAYNASKSAVKTIAEHLSFTLHESHPNVSVHLLVPGFTYTGLVARYFPSKPDGAWTPEQVIDYMEGKMAQGAFYILCPDNEVTEELDQRRIAWGYGDMIHGRPALTRWRSDWKEKAAKGIEALEGDGL
ncbi:short chain dehydrogenase/reductase [Aspergillus heteromorphus CBS 117.55]|uniref:Short chain dehydrogenase/reductase n=1 Tax=Aspergillus heteromorphus CBS 117.55 TaxID=1448321 RepID=A0A317V470_9EURO|nr:short chain dehydrogenase/reductase [Aspergillus heteromorphus CBS 117.55]PWY69074.1 short chain dehydrogenase/reductase [Aspergillus heteromorphus CBS 117.55]